ncbi:kinase-like domain-containing protein [Chytridium lagenaria]|nr:kinase-like domain-containing protein [Chytridium lagenaria]
MTSPSMKLYRKFELAMKLSKPMSLGELGNSPPIANFSRYGSDGKLNFSGSCMHAMVSYKISMSELTLEESLARSYGVVQKVHHKPRTNAKSVYVHAAMKEIRLELDQTKLNQILMELDVLHKSQSPYISCVYYCMEYMDAGSIDKLYGDGIREDVLAKITIAMSNPQIFLVNSKGEVKLCDFGVSGQLIQSLAKTNIGCQSYMAPERISVDNPGTYSVQSDVWSLGLSVVEMAIGKYPYPTEQYDSVFAQLNAIVSGDPPNLPDDHYSSDCRDFVAQCLNKNPRERPTYGELLDHPWVRRYQNATVDMSGWASEAIARKKILLKAVFF